MQKLIFPIRYLSLTITAAPAAKLRGLAPPGWLIPAVALLLLYAALYPPGSGLGTRTDPGRHHREEHQRFYSGSFCPLRRYHWSRRLRLPGVRRTHALVRGYRGHRRYCLGVWRNHNRQ